MSQEDLDSVRAAFEAFNRGDLDAVAEFLHPEIEWSPPAELPGTRAYHGLQGVREAQTDMLDAFGALRLEPERLIDADDRVVVLFRWRGHGKASGVSLDLLGEKGAAVFGMRDGKVIRADWYVEWAQALEAAGLTG